MDPNDTPLPNDTRGVTPPVEVNSDETLIARVEAMSPEERLADIRGFRTRQLQGDSMDPDETRYALALIRSTRAPASKPKGKKAPVRELSLDELLG